MTVIKQTYEIDAPVAKVWQALTDPSVIEKWGGGPAVMDELPGTDFKLWGGDIFGKNTKVIKYEILEQEWYGGKWDKPSHLVFKLKPNGKKTMVTLIQENVPENEIKDIADGWKSYYMGPIKNLFEK